MEYTLTYKNKETEKEILEDTPTFRLNSVKEFGKSRWYTDWDNMLLFGDNLSILKALTNNHSVNGKVKLVYIDPPFATNQKFRAGAFRTSTISSSHEDEIAYEDKLVGAEFLEFLRKRLVFLKELLADDGSIYVHIDWKKGHYVKVLMDEIFGEENFINDIARIKCGAKNFDQRGYGNIKDMILFYSKTDNYVWNDSREKYTPEDLEELFPKIDRMGRKYTTTPLHAPGETKNGSTGHEWKALKPPKGRHWRHPPDELTKLDEQGLIEWSSTGNPRKIIYASDFEKKQKKRQDIWSFKDPFYPSYPTEKNLEMLKVIVKASSNPDDIVLDCFAGSGTTLMAAEELGRKWIGIDRSEVAIKTGIRRLSRLKDCKQFMLYDTAQQPFSLNFQESPLAIAH
jgi:adenine-specific DNA-methyltransferase